MPDVPNGAMIDEFGQLFYPDSPEDACLFTAMHGAEFGGPCTGRETYNPSTCSCSCHGCNYNCAGYWRYIKCES